MTWLGWLIIAVLLTATAAVTGIKPSGTRHVARTGLMRAARFVLVFVILVLAYVFYRARAGG